MGLHMRDGWIFDGWIKGKWVSDEMLQRENSKKLKKHEKIKVLRVELLLYLNLKFVIEILLIFLVKFFN